MNHRKLFLISVLSISIILTSTNIGLTKVGNNVQCSTCHTMHNSQHGEAIEIPYQTGIDSVGPNDALLYATSANSNSPCVGCHAVPGATILNGYDETTGAPQIKLPTSGNYLAGGTYAESDDGKKHNVLGLADPDSQFGDNDIPPGGSNDDIGGAEQITCAGRTGCHGNRSESNDLRAVHGAHHANDSDLDGSEVGTCYRFLTTMLESDTLVPYESTYAVKGLENRFWEVNGKNTFSMTTDNDPNEHNVYVADINKVCASCHGLFHQQIADHQGTEEPWIRHPTDITLADAAADGPSDEYLSYPNNDSDIYSTEVPVGYDISEINTPGNVSKTQGQVLCISCHRAHGGEYDDLLRWNYAPMVAGDDNVKNGCKRCHTTK